MPRSLQSGIAARSQYNNSLQLSKRGRFINPLFFGVFYLRLSRLSMDFSPNIVFIATRA
jgi:hypothetical protein